MEFSRSVRTQNSEQYFIHNDEGLLGEFSLHYQSSVHGTFIIVQDIDDEQLDFILNEVEDKIVSMIEPREDFIFSVYKGREVGFYSDTGYSSFNVPVTQGDLKAVTETVEKVSRSVSKVLNKHAVAAGQINQFAVVDYFKKMGYEASIASPELDHKKIDVLAENETTIIFIQVKKGQISNAEIKKVVEYVVDQIQTEKEKEVCIVADKFNSHADLFRLNLQKAYNVNILFVHKYQILSVKPEYKRVLD